MAESPQEKEGRQSGQEKPKPHEYHRFMDEAGDTTFYGKGKIPIVGITEGVSLSFILGLVKFRTQVDPIRESITQLQKKVETDTYYAEIPSIQKKISGGGFYFHASADIPEARKVFFEFIKTVECSFEAVVGRKIPSLYTTKHNNNESEFYADLLSHLLKNKMELGNRLVLNVAERGKTTRNENLRLALEKALGRYHRKKPAGAVKTQILFNVQTHRSEPLLNVADYLCWSIQRLFEKGETRYYDYIQQKISVVVDVYDRKKYEGGKNYYTEKNRLGVKNKLSPPLH